MGCNDDSYNSLKAFRRSLRNSHRPYLYSILALIAVYLVYRWLSAPKIVGRFADDERMKHIKPPLLDYNSYNEKSYESNGYYGSTGNVVHVEIYMEAQCGDSTRFVRRQLGPVWEKFKNTGRLDIKAIVFGKASCHPEAGDYSCRCQHGQRECDLNQLMNCVQDFFFNDAKRYIPVFTCIQGKTDLDYAKDYCIANNPDLPLETIMKCATGRRGRILMAAAGQKTAALDPPLSNVPLIRVDGEKSIDAFYEFQETICAKMKPQPAECSK